jgi:signal transduction histidine kinase
MFEEQRGPAEGQALEGKTKRLLEAGRALVSELNLDEVLVRILDAARDLTGARYAAIGILDEGKSKLDQIVFVGFDEETRRRIGPLPRGEGVLGELIREPKPLRLKKVGDHPRSYGFPLGHPPMTTFLGAPIMIRGEPYGNIYLTDKADGAEFDESDEELVTMLAQWAAVAINNARLYTDLRDRRKELEDAVLKLKANVDLSRTIAGETSTARVLELITKRGRAALHAATLVLMVVEEDELVVAAAAGERANELIDRRVLIDQSIAGAALRQRKTMTLDRADDLIARRNEFGVGKGYAMFLPIEFRGEPRGVLGVFDRLDGDATFDANDELTAHGIAAAAGAALSMTEAVEAERVSRSIAAAESEKKRWSRELHDEALQELTALRADLEAASESDDDRERREFLSQALSYAKRCSESIYNLINELRPSVLDESGLPVAIEALVERALLRGSISVEYRNKLTRKANGELRRFDPEFEIAAYRLVQEALNNAIKHANASTVTVELDERNGTLSIVVADDGVGFDPSRVERGFGLINMNERAAMLGGSVEFTSAPALGTRCNIELPVPRQRGPRVVNFSG